MIRFGRLLLFCLVAFWFPATMHCRLEAAGFFEAHDGCAEEQSTGTSSDCKDDACPTVEQALFKESSTALKISAPAEFILPPFLALVLSAPEPDTVALSLSPERHAPPREIAVAWQFIARAAPPSRAPSSLSL